MNYLSLFEYHSGLCLQQDLTCLNIIAPSYPYIAYLLFAFLFQLYLGTCGRAILFWARALLFYLFELPVHLVRLIMF